MTAKKSSGYLAAKAALTKGRNHQDWLRRDRHYQLFVNLRDDPEELLSFLSRRARTPVDKDTERYRLLQENLRSAWSGNKEAVEQIREQLSREDFRFEIGRRRMILQPRTVFGEIMLPFLRDCQEGMTAICANPDCQSPYFIKKRRTQKYCEAGPCTEKAQREQKLEWWRKNRGSQRERKKK